MQPVYKKMCYIFFTDRIEAPELHLSVKNRPSHVPSAVRIGYPRQCESASSDHYMYFETTEVIV